MNATDVIAGYAAVVATAALGWEIRKARQARRPQVEVAISYAVLGYPDRGMQECAHIEVRNRGDLPVRVTSAGFKLQDGSDMIASIPHQQPAATIPGVIEPRDSGFTYRFWIGSGPLSVIKPTPGR